MKTWAAALALTAAGAAAAQPGPPPPAPAPAEPAEPPAAPATDSPPLQPPPPPPVTAARPEPRADSGRPTGLAFGIGLGYALPTSLQTPNTTSVRIRLPSGLTFEPQLAVATSTDETATTSTQQTELTLGSLVRYPLRAHNRVDLEAVGNASVSNRVVDPSGDHNNRTITMLGLGYGVALGYWLTAHWNLSLTASNTLAAFSRTRQDTGIGMETTTRTTTLGLVFDPQVALMLHLYD